MSPASQTFSQLIRNVISRQTNATDVLSEMENMPNFDELDGSDLFAQVLADRSPFARIEGVSKNNDKTLTGIYIYKF